MKLRISAAVFLLVFVAGCASDYSKMQEEAVDVPRLTKVMHVHVRHLNLPADCELSQEQVRLTYSEALRSNPDLALPKQQYLAVRWCSGEIVLLIRDSRTDTACFEDASCTPKLDWRWYESPNPPSTFTIAHPQTCGCGQSGPDQGRGHPTSP